ncbi:MAG: glycosyltransferase family 2 protein [Candidatus Magnetominusculus sp. LBB02]|nr:glycosyltransferase family 2 protein [Candidatus Magnetominusculus sp. LBB02]
MAIEHITVCLCTFKRAALLEKLLYKLESLNTQGRFTYSVSVVDNDYAGSAKAVVSHAIERAVIDIVYDIEPQQNIAMARNRAVRNAKGGVIAFIDDDELPDKDWLLNLYDVYDTRKVSGVVGAVIPYFEVDGPDWLKRFYYRAEPPTLTVLNWKDTRSGNVMLDKRMIVDEGNYFEPGYGITGSEDIHCFKRMIEKGHIFVSCKEAVVKELVPKERFKAGWLIKRVLRTGGTYGRIKTEGRSAVYTSLFVARSLTLVFVGTMLLPFTIISGIGTSLKYILKIVTNIGKIAGIIGGGR